MTKNPDLLSPEIRKVEREIDHAYRANRLTSLKFSEAAWYLLAIVEDSVLTSLSGELYGDKQSIHTLAALTDSLVTHMQYALEWLYKACIPGGRIPYNSTTSSYQAAVELLKMAAEYKSFVAAFTYASQGLLELELRDHQLVAKHTFFRDTRYEVYSRLLKPSVDDKTPSLLAEAFELISSRVKISGDRFSYKLDAKIVEAVKELVQHVYSQGFKLPLDWTFSRYSLKEFLEFATTLGAMTVIHWNAHSLAAISGRVGLGCIDSVLVFDNDELIYRIRRYSDLSIKVISEIVSDLTYGNKGIRHPDPALQPLIRLNKHKYAIAPWLWLDNDVERNFTVLLNKLPSEKEIYAKLVNDKEDAMRIQIIKELSQKGFRFANGIVRHDKILTDIDLALINDVEKVCLILELKWFIDPADIGEVIDRTEDLKKGVTQLNRIREQAIKKFEPLLRTLGIDESYMIEVVLVSANWIGFEDVQDPNVPIINQRHLMHKIQAEESLMPVIEWLRKRAYLPTEGVEYEIKDDPAEIAGWKLTWYGIKVLMTEEFLPL